MEYSSPLGNYNVDICLVIDKTGSMKPIMDVVKENALNLYRDVRNALEIKGKHVSRFRIRVIWFGDYLADRYPMVLSDFLEMPEDLHRYEAFVKGVNPEGGGDAPEIQVTVNAEYVKNQLSADIHQKDVRKYIL